MRRILIIVMLLFLPLQVSWAAISVYCDHETGAAAQHLGHHDHEHKEQAKNSSKSDSFPTLDTDCAFCLFNGVSILTSPALALPAAILQVESEFLYADSLSSPSSDRPDRPKWTRVA